MNFKSVTARAALVAVMALVLTACGSNSKESADQAVIGNSDTVEFADGYPLPNCTGQDSSSCTYGGFNPEVDGFSFANWGSEAGALGASDLIALFGRKNVCASGSGDNCVLYPAAQQWVEQVNEGMSGGRCEGIAATAELIYGGYLEPSDFDPNATSTFDLTKDNPAVSNTIEYFWATQMVAPVQNAYQGSQKLQPSQIADELAKGLLNEAGYTLGIYSDLGGHALNPFAVTNEGDSIAIHVYDNNYPGTVQRVMIDPDLETWSYAAGTTNPAEQTTGWEGGQGTIELTPMDVRLGTPFPAPFKDSKRGGKTSQLMLTSPDPSAKLGISLTIDGTEYNTGDPDAKLRLPPVGVVVRTVRSAEGVMDGNWTIVTVDREQVGDFEATIALQGQPTESVPVTMSIDDPGSPRVTTRAFADSSDAEAVSFEVARDGAVNVSAAPEANATVNVANGLNGANFELFEGVSMRVDSLDDDGVSEVTYIDDETGEFLGEFDLSDESDNGSVTEIEADFTIDEDGTGSFEVTEEEVRAEEVDENWIELVEGATDPESGFGNDEPANDESGNDGGGGGAESDESGNDEPANDEPGNDEPGNDEPGNDEPANDGGGDDEPGNDEPANDESVEE
jgi:hypothetical protein